MDATIAPADLLDCAVDATRTAGRHALDQFARRTDVAQRTRHDVKLKLDLECQAKAESCIRSRYATHSILGEEDEPNALNRPETDSAYEWIIDPIDGTVNFSHGMHRWCCSIAVRRAGVVLAGAVYAPHLDEMYTASIEQESRCNGEPIRVSTTPDLATAIVYTGLDKNIDSERAPFELFCRLAAQVQKTRVLGAAAIDICHVAAGRGDAYFESGIYVWDIAAADLIVRQAGGATRHMGSQGGQRLSFLAGNGLINDALDQLLTHGPSH